MTLTHALINLYLFFSEGVIHNLFPFDIHSFQFEQHFSANFLNK